MRSRAPTHNGETVASAPLFQHHVAGRETAIPESPALFLAICAVLEGVAISVVAYLANVAYHIAIGVELGDIWLTQSFVLSLVISALVLMCSLILHPAFAFQGQGIDKILANGIAATGLGFSLFVSGMFFLKITDQYSRGAFIFQLASVAALVVVERSLLFAGFRSATAAGLIRPRRVILIGDTADCLRLADQMKDCGVRIVGSFSKPGECDPTAAPCGGHDIQSLIDTCRALKAHEIFVLNGPAGWPKINELLDPLSHLPVGLHLVPMRCEEIIAKSRIAEFGNVATIQVARPPLSNLDELIKRSFDVCAAISGLILLSPLLLMVSVAIKVDSRGPVFFRQLRYGYNRDKISVLKFRSMNVMEDGGGRFEQARPNDPRVTRVGRVLRRTSLDELPQLLNVLLGEMSIVGPRPHATAHNELFETLISSYARRHAVKPGITGWAQVNGSRGETDTNDKMRRRADYDLYYIDNWSVWFDLKIIVLTLFSKQARNHAY